jgi:hypothetical protein
VHDPGDTLVTIVVDGVIVARLDARRPDLALVEALVRMQLCARRRGTRIRLLSVSADLRGLLELVGLAEVLAHEPRREAELGEQLGIEEVVQPGDLLA